jgi:hypothetical protein
MWRNKLIVVKVVEVMEGRLGQVEVNGLRKEVGMEAVCLGCLRWERVDWSWNVVELRGVVWCC